MPRTRTQRIVFSILMAFAMVYGMELYNQALLAGELVATWLQAVALNFPMALLWQLFVAGPAVHAVVRAMGVTESLLRRSIKAGRATTCQS